MLDVKRNLWCVLIWYADPSMFYSDILSRRNCTVRKIKNLWLFHSLLANIDLPLLDLSLKHVQQNMFLLCFSSLKGFDSVFPWVHVWKKMTKMQPPACNKALVFGHPFSAVSH